MAKHYLLIEGFVKLSAIIWTVRSSAHLETFSQTWNRVLN